MGLLKSAIRRSQQPLCLEHVVIHYLGGGRKENYSVGHHSCGSGRGGEERLNIDYDVETETIARHCGSSSEPALVSVSRVLLIRSKIPATIHITHEDYLGFF